MAAERNHGVTVWVESLLLPLTSDFSQLQAQCFNFLCKNRGSKEWRDIYEAVFRVVPDIVHAVGYNESET